MGMVTGITAMIIKTASRQSNSIGLIRPTVPLLSIMAAVGLAFIDDAQAANQYVRPSIDITQSYSDNVNLLPKGSEEGAFVTQINPGISFRKEGPRINVAADFRVQNILYAGSDNPDRTLFQGQANGNIELLKKSVYLDLAVNHTQRNQSNRGRIARDNIARSDNRTDVTTFSVSPYWTPHLGGFLDGEVRLRYAEVHTNGLLGDTRLHEERIHLVSGHDFNRFSWRFDFSNQEQNLGRVRRQGSNTGNQQINPRFQKKINPRFQNVEGEIRQHLSKRYSLFAVLGNNNSRFTGSEGANRNGVYGALGAAWRVNRKLALEAAIGNNWYATVDITPTSRTNWKTTYRHEDVGNNIGNRWETLFSHASRNTSWTGSYAEETITPQNIVLDEDTFSDPVEGQPLQLSNGVGLTSLVNEVFIRKRGAVSFTGRTAKNTFNFQLYQEKRDFRNGGNDEDAVGVDGAWFWQFARQTRSTVRAGWEEIKFDSQSNPDTQLWLVSVRVNQRVSDYFDIANYIDGFLEYRFSSQNSDSKKRDLDNNEEYVENRISAGVNINF